MPPRIHPRKLLVEGATDKRVIPYLMEANGVAWEPDGAEAARSGASFKDVHRRKAEIHTWLAWQDEPGKQLHEAVHHRVLDPEKPESRPFVGWFRRLFRV